MKKIGFFIFFTLFFTQAFSDQGVYTFEKENNIFYYSRDEDKVLQLTSGGKNSASVLSPNGKWIAYVKRSKNIMPIDCAHSVNLNSQYANELWVIDLSNRTQQLLVKNNFSCDDPKKMIVDPKNLQFSPDNKTLYFQTTAWETSDAIHAVTVSTGSLRFVTDGNQYHVIQTGKYRGDLIANQYRYHFKDDMPSSSDHWDWLFTPAGKQIKLYRKEN